MKIKLFNNRLPKSKQSEAINPLFWGILTAFIVNLSVLAEVPRADSISQIEAVDWHILLEDMAENGMQTEEWEETLTELANNPIQLNTASKEQLEGIPFLNADQVENLSYYLYRYGPIVSLSELLLVEGMDSRTMRWLSPFVCVGDSEKTQVVYPPMKKALRYGKQELRILVGSILQKKSGYDAASGSSDRYSGDPLHASIRYGFDYKDQLQWGLVMEKDAGEKWWNRENGGFDYLSFHLLVKDSKRMNTLILGDYKVRFGQGLVFGSAFSLGKTTAGGIPEISGSFLSRHFSASEIGFFRGAALRLTLKPYIPVRGHRFGIDLTSFYSVRKLDSSIEKGGFSSISETGLHRLPAEINIQKQLMQSVLGGHIQFRWTNLQIGITAAGWLFNTAAAKPLEIWKLYHLQENKGGNISADFRTVFHGLLVFGEAALDQKGHGAILAGTSFKPYPRMTVSMLGRNYTPEYLALFSNAFSEGTSTKNEKGLYTSTEFILAKGIRVSAYYDVFRFPWLSYNVSAPSCGQEIATELNASVGRNGLVRLLFKSKTKEKNAMDPSLPTNTITPYLKNQVRLQISEKQGFWILKTVLHANEYRSENQQQFGYALAQDIGFEPSDTKFSIQLHAVLFSTDSWENRMYLWEKDLPGAFSMPMLYGQGCRMAVISKYNLKNFCVQLKIADSVQPGMESLGVGPERINGSRRTEARLLLSWKF